MIKGIITGLKTYGTSFGLVTKLKLWKYFAIPILISLLTAIIIGLCAYSFSDNIGHWIEQIWPWEWGKQGFYIFAEILSALFIIALGFILYKHIVMALSAPFMGPVSEKIEVHLLGQSHEHKENKFSVQLWRGIRINVRNLCMELLITIPILLLGLIPVIGFIVTILLFLIQAYYAGFGNMDYTLERYFNYQKSIRFVRKHKGEAIGNGIVFMLFLLIPVVGVILVLPLSVTAATVQTIDLLDIKKK
ncbi:coproporphyrinogen III oxidase [Flavobacteriaceae bacterium R38]|nr:coproporphyrinogen III oxidase [Flavobacteriaceae bacterium R38]